MGSYAYKYCMCFTRKFRSPDAQPPPDVRAAYLSYCCSSDPHGLRRFLSQVQGESPADVDRILATLAPTWAAHGIARLVTRSPATAPPTLEEFFGFLFSSDLNPPINNQQTSTPFIPPRRFHFYTTSSSSGWTGMGNWETTTEGVCLKLGIRKNSNGQWEISKRGDGDSVLSSDNDRARHMENKNCINLTCSTEETDIGDEVYNSEPGRNDYPMAHVHDLDSSPSDENAPPPSMEQDVIVLSDSDDDAVTVLSPSAVKWGSAHGTGDLFAPNPPETSGVCGEQLGGCPNETSFLALEEGFDDLGLSFWERPLSPRDDPTCQMFDPGARVTDNPGEVDEPIYGGDLGTTAVAANPLEDSLANLGDGHPEKRTAGSISGADDCSSNDRNVAQKRKNPPGSGITAVDGAGDGVSGEEQRSVRAKLILSIDSESDD